MHRAFRDDIQSIVEGVAGEDGSYAPLALSGLGQSHLLVLAPGSRLGIAVITMCQIFSSICHNIVAEIVIPKKQEEKERWIVGLLS